MLLTVTEKSGYTSVAGDFVLRIIGKLNMKVRTKKKLRLVMSKSELIKNKRVNPDGAYPSDLPYDTKSGMTENHAAFYN